ncbi:glutathione S-transferase [Pseudomonas sp.]|uniref:glutathione S-transferase n=1 Tax=Pseudomonas sp. TaxID=306 RepID=UPI002733784E|nr:glutathione S-transferase [Pseudomonas sp.]MDP3815040.1 glutathione S-transferase [Pseudomonas sp.]
MVITLAIGDFGKSSWSLRAWLVLKTADVSFSTQQVKLEQADTRATILQYSASGKVPALGIDGITINDSLAIAEYIAEIYPNARLWPEEQSLRALARAAAAEMHSGFTNLRTQLSFGLNTGDTPETLSSETQGEIQRICQIWRNLLAISGSSEFLCGNFGIVDAMYVPVIFRLRRYGIALPADLQGYANNILNYAPVQQWVKLALKEAQ